MHQLTNVGQSPPTDGGATREWDAAILLNLLLCSSYRMALVGWWLHTLHFMLGSALGSLNRVALSYLVGNNEVNTVRRFLTFDA